MAEHTRRSVGAAVVATALAGCQRGRSAPPAVLLVENRHDLPHVVAVEIGVYSSDGSVDAGTEHAQIPVDPGESRRFEGLFNDDSSYRIRATIPGSESVVVEYGREGSSIHENRPFLRVGESGMLTGGIRSV
ncbi:hypothetical protein [Halobaculum lipolyticum]|uniref:Uncharacterized protein n=1 Tax=Halobaculum lipolyticum TaxID=3032001 RepID=A0ABD5WE55_9EURY|nr:hypothetical protein [Halobaculum sp. DT31]